MGLYLGSSKKLKIFSNNKTYRLNIPSSVPITNGTKLLSKDGHILKDSNGVYLTVKEDE